MPTDTIAIPQGLQPGELAAYTGITVVHYTLDPATTAAAPGTVVELQTWNGTASGAASAPAWPTVTQSSTTADYNIVGVVIGANVTGQTVQPGQVAMICTRGICQVLSDGSTTAGHAALQSEGTAGVAEDEAVAVVGSTIGTWLETKTISSPPGLANCLIRLA